MRRAVSSLIFICLILTLAGCGEKEISGVTGKEISSDGSTRAIIVRDFDESLYDKNELTDMMNSEAEKYNSLNAPEAVKVVSVECSDGVVTAVMDYATAEDYSAFNNRKFIWETYESAVSNGDIRVSLKDISDMSDVDMSMITDPEKLDVVITDEQGYILLPGKVRFISSGVESVTRKQINVTDDMDGLAYIVYQRK